MQSKPIQCTLYRLYFVGKSVFWDMKIIQGDEEYGRKNLLYAQKEFLKLGKQWGICLTDGDFRNYS